MSWLIYMIIFPDLDFGDDSRVVVDVGIYSTKQCLKTTGLRKAAEDSKN